jgi:hypothetical protein
MWAFVAQKQHKISLAKMNCVGTCFKIGTEKIRLCESHYFGMFLIAKKLSLCSKFPAHTALVRKSWWALYTGVSMVGQ